MGPTRKSRSVNKRFSYYSEVSPVRHAESAERRSQQKRKSSDLMGPHWSKEELEHFYEAYRKHGKDWKKVGAVLRNRSVEMVEALYSMNRAYLSLPEGTASVAGLIAMMTDHYNNLGGSDNEPQSNDGAGTSRKPTKRGRSKVQPKTSKGYDGDLLSRSLEVASSYDRLGFLKKKRSVGSRPRVVGKRTPRFPVSYSYENMNGKNYLSPTRQGIFKVDADDDEVAEIAKKLTEVSYLRGSPQGSLTAKRLVGSSDMDEDGLEGSVEADNGDFTRTRSSWVKSGNLGTSSQKGRRRCGNRAEVVSNGNNHLDETREACSGTEEGQLSDAGKISDTEVTDAKVSRSAQDRRRSKKVLFRRDEVSDLHALEVLADCSLMPESTNDDEPSVHINKRSRPWKVPGGDVSASSEADLETHQSVKLPRNKQKSVVSKIPKPEAYGDTHIGDFQETEGKSVEKITNKGKRSSQSTSPMVVKHAENRSITGSSKEGGDSAIPTVHIHVANQVDKITKGRSKRKMMLQRAEKYANLTSPDKIVRDQPAAFFPSLHGRAHNLKEKLTNCFSNHQVRRWCAFEWFYSAIDYPWFAKREFVEYLYHVGLGHVPRLTRVEWGVIRSSLGKPRRFSIQFLKEEKEKLNHYRDSVRTHYTELRKGSREGLPADLARPLSVGQRVIAIHPKTREIYDGSVLTVDHNRCRIQFDRAELGVEFVMDIDCMPANPLENMPASVTRRINAVGNFCDNFNELKMNVHIKDEGAEGSIKFAPGENLENCNDASNMLPSTYPLCNLFKQSKVASSIVNSQAQMLPKEHHINQQMTYSQPSLHAQIGAKEADVQAIAELTRALEKKNALILEWGKLNNDMSENEKNGESVLKESELFRKQYAAIVLQLQEANEQVSTALYRLRQRNSYQGNLSLPWPRPTTNMYDSTSVLSSFNCFDDSEESRMNVNEIVESSRTTASSMVNSAIQAYSSRSGGNSFEKIEEVIDYVNDQLSDYSYMPAEGSFATADSGNVTSHELFKPNMPSPLQAPSSKQLMLVPSELITKCVATLLMIQKCTERQFPPADVAEILDFAVTSLQPRCSHNLPVYADIEKCMIMIKNQIMALIPT